MRIENYIQIGHIMLYHFEKGGNAAECHFAIPTNFLAKEQSAKAKLKNGSHQIACLQWTIFGIPLGETPDETFFFLTFLKRSHDSFAVAFCCFWDGGPIQPISIFWDDERWSNGPHWSLRPTFCLSSFRPLPRLLKAPGRRNSLVELFLHLRVFYRPIWTIFHFGFWWLFVPSLKSSLRSRNDTVLYSKLSPTAGV